MVDAKYAMLSGLSHTLLPRGWDTKQPKNISDDDLLPTATEPIQDKEGPTDMILVIVVFTIAKHLINLPGIETILMINEMESTLGTAGANKEKVEEYRRAVLQLSSDLDETLTKFSTPNAGPLHQLAQHLKTHIMRKLAALANPPGENPDWGIEVFDHTSHAFKLAVETTAHSVEQYKMESYPGWDWFSRLHFQLDIFAYLVGQLCHRTAGQLVDRAWEAVEEAYKYHPEFYEITNRVYYQLAHFIFKAWRKREEALRNRLGCAPEIPECVKKLRLVMPGSDDSSVKSEAGRTPNNDIFSYANAGASSMATNGGIDPITGVEGPTFDVYMGNYFDFNGPMNFDLWGNTQSDIPNGIPHLGSMQPMQLQDMTPYGGMGHANWK